MIHIGSLADYSYVEMLLGVIPKDMRIKVELKVELDARDPSKLQ